MQPFSVTPERLDQALRVFEMKMKMTPDAEKTLLLLANELHLYEGISYSEFGLLQFEFTELQWVAVAACAAAIAETQGQLAEPNNICVTIERSVLSAVG